MSRIRAWGVFGLLVLFGSLAFSAEGAAESYRAKVVGITDGDTLTVLREGKRQVKLRLHGVDAPERRQDFYAASKKFLSDLVFRKMVTVEELGERSYRREIARVKLSDGRDLGSVLVENGYAWWYEYYAPKNEALKKAQELAKEKKRGIWSKPCPQPPWSLRRKEVFHCTASEALPLSKTQWQGKLRWQNGPPMGFQVIEVEASSDLVANFRIRPGDVILSVNDIEFADVPVKERMDVMRTSNIVQMAYISKEGRRIAVGK